MPDEKDRYGEKLREVERAREDLYFQEQDRKLIEKQRQQRQAQSESDLKQAALMRCPKCGERLRERLLNEVSTDECPSCGGLWLDKGEFEKLAAREQEGWFGRLLRARG